MPAVLLHASPNKPNQTCPWRGALRTPPKEAAAGPAVDFGQVGTLQVGAFTSSPGPVHRVTKVLAAWLSWVERITSTDESYSCNKGPDQLRGAWKAKFDTVKPWSGYNHRSSVTLEPDWSLHQKLERSRRATEKVPLLSKGLCAMRPSLARAGGSSGAAAAPRVSPEPGGNWRHRLPGRDRRCPARSRARLAGGGSLCKTPPAASCNARANNND